MLGDNLKKLRGSMPQSELAEKVGFSQSAISQYESGEREPDLDTLRKLTEIFSVSLDELVNGSPEKETQNA